MKWKEKRTVKQWYEAASYEIARPQAVTLWAGFIKHFTLKVLVEGEGEHSLKVSLQMKFFTRIVINTPRWSWNHPKSFKLSFNSKMC